MAGWTNIPVAAGDDMSLRTTYLELMGAWNECRQMLGQATVSDPAAGDPCFDSAATYSIKKMQEWIESNCTSFVVSHDAGSPPTLRADGYYSNKASIDFYTTGTLRSTAGINAGGFKKTATPTYGVAAAGDDVLVDHFNELRLAFNVLAWTLTTATYSDHSENNQRLVTSGSYVTWNAAYTAAQTAFDGGSGLGAVSPGSLAICYGVYDSAFATYTCTLERYYGYGEFSGIPTFISHEMDVYLWSAVPAFEEPANTYFAHGDGVIQDKFALTETFASAATATRTTAKIGQITTSPSQGPAPTNPSPSSSSPYGWSNRVALGAATVPQGVIRWDKTYS